MISAGILYTKGEHGKVFFYTEIFLYKKSFFIQKYFATWYRLEFCSLYVIFSCLCCLLCILVWEFYKEYWEAFCAEMRSFCVLFSCLCRHFVVFIRIAEDFPLYQTIFLACIKKTLLKKIFGIPVKKKFSTYGTKRSLPSFRNIQWYNHNNRHSYVIGYFVYEQCFCVYLPPCMWSTRANFHNFVFIFSVLTFEQKPKSWKAFWPSCRHCLKRECTLRGLFDEKTYTNTLFHRLFIGYEGKEEERRFDFRLRTVAFSKSGFLKCTDFLHSLHRICTGFAQILHRICTGFAVLPRFCTIPVLFE